MPFLGKQEPTLLCCPWQPSASRRYSTLAGYLVASKRSQASTLTGIPSSPSMKGNNKSCYGVFFICTMSLLDVVAKPQFHGLRQINGMPRSTKHACVAIFGHWCRRFQNSSLMRSKQKCFWRWLKGVTADRFNTLFACNAYKLVFVGSFLFCKTALCLGLTCISAEIKGLQWWAFGSPWSQGSFVQCWRAGHLAGELCQSNTRGALERRGGGWKEAWVAECWRKRKSLSTWFIGLRQGHSSYWRVVPSNGEVWACS